MTDPKQAKVCAELLQAIAEPNRIRIIECLRTGSKNVTELAKDSPREVAFTRAQVVRDVLHDPLWYLRILARRLVATVTEIKLLPRASIDGRSFSPATSENEGATDVYSRLLNPSCTFTAAPASIVNFFHHGTLLRRRL